MIVIVSRNEASPEALKLEKGQRVQQRPQTKAAAKDGARMGATKLRPCLKTMKPSSCICSNLLKISNRPSNVAAAILLTSEAYAIIQLQEFAVVFFFLKYSWTVKKIVIQNYRSSL